MGAICLYLSLIFLYNFLIGLIGTDFNVFCFGLSEKLNVLWRKRWLEEAGEVLKKFEKDVIRMAKTEGYDGGDSSDDSAKQWDFPGALLYSVTVITTIGRKY